VGGTDGSPSCVDEEEGCPTEALIFCAFDQLSDIHEHIDFLACMDESEGAASDRASACAGKQQIDAAKMKTCATGSRGASLLQDAHTYYEKSKGEGKIDGFPTLLVNDKSTWTRDWGTVTRAFCDAGLECACNLPEPTPTPPPTPSPTPPPTPPTPTPPPAPSPPPAPTPSPSPVPASCSQREKSQKGCEVDGVCVWCYEKILDEYYCEQPSYCDGFVV